MQAELRLKELRVHPGEPSTYEFAYVTVFVGEGGAELGRSKAHWGNVKDDPDDLSAMHTIDSQGTVRSGMDILADAGFA